jgi:hypothetical protein
MLRAFVVSKKSKSGSAPKENNRGGNPMAPLLDCMVNYFSPDDGGDGMPRRYFVYHIVAGPLTLASPPSDGGEGRMGGPTEEAGLACIMTLAVSNESERCTYCQNLHSVNTGGPEAAVAKAIRYLDAYHGGDNLRKVQSAMRPSNVAAVRGPA